MPDCRNPYCEGTVAETVPSEFCFSCAAELNRSGRALEKEIAHFLRLEAEFLTWCEEHGQPNPHED